MSAPVIEDSFATRSLGVEIAASSSIAEVHALLGSTSTGLSTARAAATIAETGPNVLRTRRARPWRVLGRQLKSPILVLLFVTAIVSVFLDEAANAIIIGVILAASIGLGFVNEFRAEREADALHDLVRHTAVVLRDGAPTRVDVTAITRGDVVLLSTGAWRRARAGILRC
ncbi:MAG: hypothetical protein KKH75_08500 [Actinobacteria bacterium]|nr:hypothetical protein [Actinomycetota bacterium]